MGATEIRIPASTSNLGASFDTCGLALGLYLDVTVVPGGDNFEIDLAGEVANRVPRDETNLIVRVARHVAQRRERAISGAKLKIESQIPLARGLGSSSSAIIAGISVYEALSGERLTDGELFRYALDFEDHGDNIAPSALGGLVVACVVERGAERSVIAIKRSWPEGVRVVLAIPEFEMDTGEMRRALPDTVPLKDAVFNLQRGALLQAIVSERRFEFFSEALRDRLHQPYRVPYARALGYVLEMNKETERHPGLLGVAMSGAGSTMIAFANNNLDAIASEMQRRLELSGTRCRTMKVEVDNSGRVVQGC